jgi:hypothetical protein
MCSFLRTSLISAVLIASSLLVAETAAAQYTIYPNYPNVPYCSGTADECFWSPMGSGSSTDCKTGTNYTTCVAKCLCDYNKNVKKCDGQLCRDLQKADYDACLTQCDIDYV